MSVDYEGELPSELREALFNRLCELEKQGTMKAQGIANVVHSLGKMNAKFAKIGEEGRASLLKVVHSRVSDFTEQGLANTIYG